jgi:predicted dehydrogenase
VNAIPEQPHEPVRVALIADAEGVATIAPALGGQPLIVVGQSGPRAEDGLPDVQSFDDPRIMLTQTAPQALLLATSTRLGVELAELAAERGLAVWRLPPLARTFAQATELVARSRQRGLLYRVASWWEMVQSDVTWALSYGQGGVRPVFTHIRVSAPGPSVQSWRASRSDAPGGVLATDSYNMLEALVAVRHLPDRVSATMANVRRRPGEAPRETEDVVTAIFRYHEGHTAAIHATWDVPPYQSRTEHHGSELSVVIEPHCVSVVSRDAQIVATRPLSTSDFLRWELRRFAEAVRNPSASPQDATLDRHIAVCALLQAVYLSTRTGQPESPAKLYEAQGWPLPRW